MESEIYRPLGLTDDEFKLIVHQLGREPNLVELAMFSIMWSEHCSYKSSRIHLRRLPTSGPRVIMGPGENAGVVAATDKISVAIRMESHNHPSAIEPTQGAATGVGGILRDIFTVGARPTALLDSLWMGTQDDPRSRWIFDGVVGGISAYGNAVGVPTVGGEIHFAPPYAENPLVNVVAVGIAETTQLVRALASGAGNHVVLLGAATGRDGIGGVSVLASSGFDNASSDKRPSVQVGDPFEEKKLIEACLRLLDAKLVVGIQDLGGAGLTCATSETAANAGNGMEVIVDKVPVRETGMTPMEILCSESQERMLAIVAPEHLEAVLAICEAEEVLATVIGTVTPPDEEGIYAGRGVLRAYFDGALVAEIPAAALADEAPLYDRPQQEPAMFRVRTDQSVVPPDDWHPIALEVLKTLDFDPSSIYRRYDHMLFRNTLVTPGADASLLAIRAPGVGGTELAMALSVDGNQLWSRSDPKSGTLAVVAESLANLACVGATPVALVDCLNFGNPEHPEVMWQFSEAIDGITEICTALGVPVIGGNVSFYNEAYGSDIDPTPVVASIGYRPLPTHPVPDPRRASGSVILVTTGETPSLSGSVFAEIIGDRRGSFPTIDLERLNHLLGVIAELVTADDLVNAATNLGAGGLLAGAVKLARLAAKGLRIELEDASVEALLAEHPSRFLLVTEQPAALVNYLLGEGLETAIIGELGGDAIEYEDWLHLVR
ncbi:phosphoribosylformylglycinamidine synthase subunit PurL [Ferrimicrobium acidiphilum]|uniref:phosphoribosylformylglycinamidine synthase subunit PurL n=2 Tax=Ferrimicrobium acidiphilum TaxID=121039 RepID=UPI0023F51ADE|nr:phosphoribosylformylglycinamidine synthase subunit PurL [Ferrimicrobium acidiphilum]